MLHRAQDEPDDPCTGTREQPLDKAQAQKSPRVPVDF